MWRCDVCNEPILKASDGWVKWRDVDGRAEGFVIIHKNMCDSRDLTVGNELTNFQDAKGLKEFFNYLFAVKDCKTKFPVRSVSEMCKLILRIQGRPPSVRDKSGTVRHLDVANKPPRPRRKMA